MQRRTSAERRVDVEVVSRRTPQFAHAKLDLIVKTGELKGRAAVLDLKDGQRGLVWCADAAFVHSQYTRRELLQPTGFPSERCWSLG